MDKFLTIIMELTVNRSFNFDLRSVANLRLIYTRRKKWNGSAKCSSVNRILSVPFVPDPFLKRTATGCGPFKERIG